MSRSKECFKCKFVKPIVEFYKHPGMADGYLNKCKVCCCRDATGNRNANIDRIRAYDRDRAKQNHRIAAAIAYTRLWRAQDKRRSAAHSAVARAIRSGLIVRLPCESCGNPQSIAHHDDYDKALAVRWLCASCHAKHHLAFRERRGL